MFCYVFLKYVITAILISHFKIVNLTAHNPFCYTMCMDIASYLKHHGHKLYLFFKYALAGGVAVAFELEIMHILTTKTPIWYIYASIISSLVSLSISFTLRKIWVFQDRSFKGLGRQVSLYLIAVAVVIGLNTILVSFWVEHFHFPYLEAQFFSGLVTGIAGFVINRYVTFRQPKGRIQQFFNK